MTVATLTSEVIPGKTTAATPALRFPFHQETGDKIKALGFWWAPAPVLCWFIPERIRASRARALILVTAERILAAAGLSITDAAGILSAARALTSMSAPVVSGGSSTAPIITVNGQPVGATPQQASLEELAATVRRARARATTPVVTATQPPRTAAHNGQPVQANLNRVVQQRMSAQRQQEAARVRALPQVVELPLTTEGQVLVLQHPLQLESGGQRLTITVEDFEKVRDLLTCPLQNSFHRELVDLRNKRSAYLDHASARGCSILLKQAGQLTEADIRNTFEQSDVLPLACDAAEFFELDDEFETLYRALGEGGSKALNHKGCSQCRAQKGS